ncbi:NAD-glutamate dehydrogenase [Amycolatopsis panacis]|uniref:NAD-glutamate dehydrogenase n=1 Tax=Amycolatopsis panacis TaxID=2340917 RepID=A0A419IBE6_9PSEU|nr:NAD-glutamate dehydrogenase [Amycolatopsis panacis]RJQ92323.1 NAD-glutamate dehydrogenase [Amycolatopsis panacis]
MSSTGASSLSGTDVGTDAGAPSGTTSPEQIRDELVEAAAARAPEIAELIRLYYRHIPADEIVGDDPVALVGAVRSHLQLAGQRMPGRPAVRLLNPTTAEDGWTREATVVQVVTDDMPYLVDSITAEFARDGVQVHRIVHPIVVVSRGLTGELEGLHLDADPGDPPAGAAAESWMYAEIDLVTDPNRARELDNRLASVLGDVREVVEDADKMGQTACALAGELEQNPPKLPASEIDEGARLLRWLADGHFTFLGYRRYELVDNPHSDTDEPALRAVLASGLGVLRQDSLAARSLTAGPDSSVDGLAPTLLVLTPASAPSTVHRPVYPYYVGVKTFDDQGRVTGEHRFLGMFTTIALHENVLDIPVVGKRVREVIHRAGFPMESFSGQRMLEVLQNWPRADLFSADSDSLYATTTGAITLSDRRRLRLFLRRDPYGRFFSCLVYLPGDRYTTKTRLAMQDVLLKELEGVQLEYSARIGETLFAQVHFIVHTDPANRIEPDVLHIQEQLNTVVRSWEDRLAEAILAERRERPGAGGAVAEESAVEQGQRFAQVFPEAYKEDFGAEDALADLRKLDTLAEEGDLAQSFYLPDDAEPGERRFKLYLRGEGVTLSKVLPVLQAMGVEVVDERPYELFREDGGASWIYDFGLRIDSKGLEKTDSTALGELRDRFQQAFHASWHGDAEVDGLNALVLRAGLSWRQVAVLRAYSRYLQQARSPFSQSYIQNTVVKHTQVATKLLRLFETRFDPQLSDVDRATREETLAAEISAMIDEVTSLDEDRILRRMTAVVNATLRTNYHVRDSGGNPRAFLALKLDPSAVPDLPEPHPKFEIFVYSPRVEGVHLRFGPVARGGLRWSDRREDFRTEILGLVKAQAVKNAVIVPVGAKGGFVVKRPPSPTGDAGIDREAQLNEGIACYRMFISGLLDLTDNRVEGATVAAPSVVRHDADDSYLVVAADKGTAKFSDIANEVSAQYGFWLGDAFASGGSVGYDHKAMGITAKGAWESVKRHFRELGKDTQTEDFTVVGIGDMMGDVFGNGMLLSEHIRLVAAFNHMHVFLDPEPDAASSFAERRRLFDLPRSSWDDYDRSLISEGGGIYPRSAKTIPVSPQVRAALGLAEGVTRLAPMDLIQAILLAPVELLWNGGIGTYVKAGSESNADAGDKANDAIRVNGDQLRVKVVGEGGNLGLTQLGRIEFARTGGKINTDALDNSAGVDCSDHEVNIKILLDHLVASGRLARTGRDELLGEMTDEVGALVLADNYRQNAVLGVSRAHAVPMVSVHARQVSALVAKGAFDRRLEALPTTSQFRALEKAGDGLSSPELATLLAHVKLDLKDELLESDLPESEVFARRLPEYFPAPLRERFAEAIAQHPLRRQIITTLVTNELVDGGGISFVFRLMEEMNATATDAVRAYAVVTHVYDLPKLWVEIAELDNLVPTEVADRMVLETRRLLDRAARWFLTNRPQPLAPLAEITRFGPVLAELGPKLGGLLRGVELESVEEDAAAYVKDGVPADLARRVALLLHSYGLLDVVEVAELAEQQVGLDATHTPADTAGLYYALSDHLGVDRMLTEISKLERGNRWHALARLSLRDDVYGSLSAITLDALRQSDQDRSVDEQIAQWEKANASRLSRARVALDEITRSGRLDLATLSVAARQIRSTVR